MRYDIYIDWDDREKIENEEMLLKRIAYFLGKTQEYRVLVENIEIKEIYYRLSSTKGIHLKIVTEIDDFLLREIDTFVIIIMTFRAIWKDDPDRIRMDLERYAKHMDIDEINRIFDIKVKNGEKYYASEWIKVYP